MGKSIRIDSNRFTLPNRNEQKFDSVPQLQRLVTCITLLQDRIMAHIRVASAKAINTVLQCWPAGHGFGELVQQLQDQSPEPLVWTV